jgi:hypothetical protein
VQAAAIAGERAARRSGDQCTERCDAILAGHGFDRSVLFITHRY